ncbi:MFS transporter [Chloroflexota bacterium]
MDFNQKRKKVFYGWYIVAACTLIALYTGGVVHFGFTAIFEPIVEEFGWSYAQVSLASSLRGFEVGLLAPLVGLLVDNLGPRRLIFGGGILCCLGFLLLSRVSSLAMFYVAFVLMAAGMSTCTGTVLMTAITNWFRRKAGWAVGIVASGFGLGGLIVPVVTGMIDLLQWRMAMVIVGLGILVIVIPLSFVVRHKPEQYGYKPDGETGDVIETEDVQLSTVNAEASIPARQALRNRTFWHIGIAMLCLAFVVSSIITHIMPYLSSLGIARTTSSLVALLIPVVSIGGRLSSGWLSDRLGSRQVFAASFASLTAGMLCLGYVTTERIWLLVPFIVTFGLGWGCWATSRITLLRKYYGRVSFGTILGFASGVMMLGNISGAPLAGWIYDTWGSYKVAWLCFSSITITGAVLALTIPSSKDTLSD